MAQDVDRNRSMELTGPIWLMQPIPYFGEKLRTEWAWEPKIDGWRMQVLHLVDGRVELWGRRLEHLPRWSDQLPDLVEIAKSCFPRGTLVDAELYSTGGRRWIRSLFARVRKAEPVVFVFDVVFWEGRFVGELSYESRKQLLRKCGFQEPFRFVVERPVTRLEHALELALRDGHEGVVIKRLGSQYEIGTEAPIATVNMTKIKR